MRNACIRCRTSGVASSRASASVSASRSRRERPICRSRRRSCSCSRTRSRWRCSASTFLPSESACSGWYPTSAERLAHPQPEALHELGDRVRLHLERVALAQPCELLGISVHGAAEVGELAEELL